MTEHSTDLHVRAIVRSVDEEINAVRRELKNLKELGILESKQRGNKLFYFLNPHSIYTPELTNIFLKNTPEVRIISTALTQIDTSDYDAIFILETFFVKDIEKDAADVEILIIGTPNEKRLASILQKVEQKLKRELHVAVLSLEDIQYRQKQRDGFLLKMLAQDKMLLLGNPAALYGRTK